MGIIDWLTKVVLAVSFGSKQIAVMLISMVPMIELKGGIPVGVKLGLGLNQSFWLAFLGSSLISIPLLLLLKPLFSWAKKNKKIGNFFSRIENIFKKKAEKAVKTEQLESTETKNVQVGKGDNKSVQTAKTEDRKAIFLKALGVFLFVAIPAPGTGVWTGSFIAVILGLDFTWSFVSVVLGNLVAGGLIVLLTALIGEKNLDLFLLILLAIVIVLLVLFLYKVLKKEDANNKSVPKKEIKS